MDTAEVQTGSHFFLNNIIQPTPWSEILNRVATAGFAKDMSPGFFESFRMGQIKSKQHLADKIDTHVTQDLNHVAVLGSWNACLLWELLPRVGHWEFYDYDYKAHQDRDYYFEANGLTKNYTSHRVDLEDEESDVWYRIENHDLVINASCEHMKTMPVVQGPFYALQSNNYTNIPEHTNCCGTLKDFHDQYGLLDTIFSGTMDMGHYQRFTIIGEVLDVPF